MWSLLNIGLYPIDSSGLYIAPRIVLLLILSVYLFYDYLLITISKDSDFKFKTIMFEFLHLVAIASVAVSAQVKPQYLAWYVSAYIVMVILGNMLAAWKVSKGCSRFILIIVDLLGLVILWGGFYFGGFGGWNIPLSLLPSLALWVFWARPPFHVHAQPT